MSAISIEICGRVAVSPWATRSSALRAGDRGSLRALSRFRLRRRRHRLEALAHEFGVADIVCFVGRMPDDELVEHYRMADVFVMPSTGEGFGIVFLEAMACGIPAIGGDADGSVDPLSATDLGRAVPPERVANAIIQVLENPPRNNQPNALDARFGLEPFTAQIRALSASLTVAGR